MAEHHDMKCVNCGAKFIGPGACPVCYMNKSTQTSQDEMTKKVMDDDNDLIKGMA